MNEGDWLWPILNRIIVVVLVLVGTSEWWWAILFRRSKGDGERAVEDSPPQATESEIEAFRELHRRSKRAKHWPQPQITSIRDCQESVKYYLSRPRDLNCDTYGESQLSYSQKVWLGIRRRRSLEPREDVRPKHEEALKLELRILADQLNCLLIWTPSTTERFSAKKWENYLVDISVLASQGALDEARRRFRLEPIGESLTFQEEGDG